MKRHFHAVRYLRRRREKLTMRKIERLNTPFTCWADLVSWQFDTMRRRYHRYHRPYPVAYKAMRQSLDPVCAADARNCGTCFCGKIATTTFLADVWQDYPNWHVIVEVQ